MSKTNDPKVSPEQESGLEPVQPQARKLRVPKPVMLVVVALALGIGGWFLWPQLASLFQEKPPPQAEVKKDIPVFRYSVLSGPLNTFYPAHSTNVDEIVLNEQIFEGLVTYRDKKLVPNLATAWTNPEETTWLFDLKKDVKFHSGRTMTAKDVVASVDQLKQNELGDIYASTIKSVEAIGDYRVKIITDGPDPILLNRLVYVYIVDSASDEKNSPLNGTGPYTLKAGTQPTETNIVLSAFDDYHGGRAYIRELELKVIEEDEKVAEALKDGSANLGSFSVPEALNTYRDQFRALYVNDPTVFGLYLNHLRTGPLQNLKVRQAMYHAIDINAFLKNIETTGTPASQLVVDDIPGYNDEIKRLNYDPKRSRELLAEAGYPKGFTLEFTYLEKISVLQAVAKELERQFKEVGITLKHDPIPRGTDKFTEGLTQSYYLGYASDLLDMSDVIGGTLQTKNYNNPEVNELSQEANKVFDAPQRAVLLRRLSKKIMDDIAFIPLFNGKAGYLLDKPYVLNIDIPAASYPGVYFWRVYEKG